MKDFLWKLSAILESALEKFRRPCPRPKKPQIISLRGMPTYLWLAPILTAWISRCAYIEAECDNKCNFSCCYRGYFSKSYSFIHGDKHKRAKVSELLCYAVCHFTVPESHFCRFWPPSDSCTLSLFILFSAVILLYILVVHLSSSKEQNGLSLFHCFCHRFFFLHSSFSFVISYSLLCCKFYTSHMIHFQFSFSLSPTWHGTVSLR